MGIRLVEERTRLGYSQANFAHQTEVNRETLRLNELGRSGISAEFLGRAAQLGVDVQYVITGIRSQSLEAANTAVSQSVQGNNNTVIYGDKGVINSGTINNIPQKNISLEQRLLLSQMRHISGKKQKSFYKTW